MANFEKSQNSMQSLAVLLVCLAQICNIWYTDG